MVPCSAALARCLSELRAHCRGEVLTASEAPLALARDFGGMLERRPALVLRAACIADVICALRSAGEHSISVTTRGAGHSQSGQGLGAGLVLDMTRLDRISEPAVDARLLEVEAGARWQDVLEMSYRRRLVPNALTHALDTTVAGTLSVGGVGGESFRAGAQVDNVAYLDVATPDGNIQRCSASEARELFDAVRAGLGQCAVILRVGYPLRACGSQLVTRCFAYADAARFLDDVARLARPSASRRWLAGAIRPSRRGERLLQLLVAEETEAANDALPELPALQCDRELTATSSPFWQSNGTRHQFFRVFANQRSDTTVQPWVEHFFAEGRALAALEAFLAEDRALLGLGNANLMFVRRAEPAAPLLRPKAGELLLGIGAFASFPRESRALAAQTMLAYADRMSAVGGVRYLSGFFGHTTSAAWAGHFGEAWPGFCAAKRRHDPRRLLNPGFIDWDAVESA